MTREKQINDAVKTSITETLMSTPNYEFSPRATDMLECAFTKGAEWADAHPANPWHKASEELPKEGQLVLISNPAIQFAIFDGLFRPVLRIGRRFEIADEHVFVETKYWMEIPELPKEK